MKSLVILAQASQEAHVAVRETPLDQRGMKSPAKVASARFETQMFQIYVHTLGNELLLKL